MGKCIPPAAFVAAGVVVMLAGAALPGVARAPAGPAPAAGSMTITYAPVGLRRNPDGTPARGPSGRKYSKNWAGYVVARYKTGASYQSVAASWIVPRVGFQPYPEQPAGPSMEFSGTWVGIGGYCTDAACQHKDGTLIQLGTGQQASSSTPDVGQYHAWYEMLPQSSIAIPALTIQAGDEVTASLACRKCGAADESWKLQMQIYRPGTGATQSWSIVVPYRSSHLSAEWIEEAPSCKTCRSPGILPLADFGTVSFQPIVRVNGRPPALSRADNGLHMIDRWGQSASPSDPTALGSLNACWSAWMGRPAATTPCAPPPPPYWQPPA